MAFCLGKVRSKEEDMFGEGNISHETDAEVAEVEEVVAEAPPAGAAVLKVFSHPSNPDMEIVQAEVAKGTIVKGPVEIANL
jgi:hypothetical protein